MVVAYAVLASLINATYDGGVWDAWICDCSQYMNVLRIFVMNFVAYTFIQCISIRSPSKKYTSKVKRFKKEKRIKAVDLINVFECAHTEILSSDHYSC